MSSMFLRCLALLLVALTPGLAGAASVRSEADPKWPESSRIYFSGAIEAGDADKLAKVILRANPRARTLIVNSQGGRIDEALRLATLVEQTKLRITIDGECASACFFVWLAGSSRTAYGYDMLTNFPQMASNLRADGVPVGFVGLHRPYEQGLQSPSETQGRLMRAVTNYLESKLVPRRLIDAMMVRPSNDIYWLTNDDLDEIGTYAPPMEEYLIQKCGYDRNSYLKVMSASEAGRTADAERIQSQQNRAFDCTEEQLSEMQAKGVTELRRAQRK